jgi:hypothetical protein
VGAGEGAAVIPLFGRATPAQRLAAEDQMLAVVREFGPLRTQAIAAAMPRAWYVTCGHEDCERPEHRKETFYAGPLGGGSAWHARASLGGPDLGPGRGRINVSRLAYAHENVYGMQIQQGSYPARVQ